jgi:hypothetical protein
MGIAADEAVPNIKDRLDLRGQNVMGASQGRDIVGPEQQ